METKKSKANKIFKSMKQLLSLAGYGESGMCFEASVALGVELAKNGITSRLKEGIIRNRPHFWLETPFGRMDVTKHQFPGLHSSEYDNGKFTGFDFEAMVVLLGFFL